MHCESGRSLIEVIGVIAVAGMMTAAAIGMYNVMRARGVRQIAAKQIEEVAQNARLLMEMRGDYTGISVNYLVKAGALDSPRAPIGSEWSVESTTSGDGFSINLNGLTSGECEYFSVATPRWATRVMVNGFDAGTTPQCFSSATNKVSFIVE